MLNRRKKNNERLIGRLIVILTFLIVPVVCLGQDAGPIRSSPAYAEVLLRKTELQADLEAFLESYTETNPRVVDTRFELAALDKSLEKIFGVKATETGKLTLALGKLLVKRAALETQFARLRRSYNAAHPEVKRAKRRVEIFDTAIKDVLN